MPRRRAKRLPQRRPEEVALRALRAADRSRAELDARLQRAGVEEAEREETLDSLERLGYLDDERTAALVEPGGAVAIAGEGPVYFLRASTRPEVCRAGVDRNVSRGQVGCKFVLQLLFPIDSA